MRWPKIRKNQNKLDHREERKAYVFGVIDMIWVIKKKSKNLQKESVIDQGARDMGPRLKVRLNLSELNSGSSMHQGSTEKMTVYFFFK